MTKFHRGTVRSGTPSYEGNVVILGDVNPGGGSGPAQPATWSLWARCAAGACRPDGNKGSDRCGIVAQPTHTAAHSWDVITRPPDSGEQKQGILPDKHS